MQMINNLSAKDIDSPTSKNVLEYNYGLSTPKTNKSLYDSKSAIS